jgi:TRAP-type C4-dicarboxylate transport system permease small subunit
MTNCIKTVDRILGWILVGLMGAAVVNVLWQVFTRFVLAHPSSFTDELARYLLIWIGLLGAAYAAGHKLHLAIDLFALTVLVFGGVSLMTLTLSLGQTSAALHVPLGYVYLTLPLSGLLIMFYTVGTVVKLVAELRQWRDGMAQGGAAQ